MFKKFILIVITTLALTLNSYASSDGNLLLKKNDPAEVKECFEKFNRASFAFNQSLDGVIFKPIASVYKTLPSPIKSGVSNSISNLSNLVTIPNNLLQGEFKKATINTGRFAVNTTLGLLGVLDIAQHLGMVETEKEDYGQTLAKGGVGPGCYVVLPVLGPSTARDAAASTLNSISTIDVKTMAGAVDALKVVDRALDRVHMERAKFGAIMSRMNVVIDNLTNVSQNQAASKARIEDADFALESSRLSKAQILQQSAMNMIAQASRTMQNVLVLFQG